MTGDELKDIREDLGNAIGRRLSVADMAKIVGMAPANGADTWRKWETGAGPSGPVAAQLDLLKLASLEHNPGPDMLRGAAVASQRFGVDFKGGVIATAILRSMLIEEIRRRLAQ
ncbi:hypothetical protein H8A95_15825 [Bradyrhizobium sp. Pear76]|uniref:helix-turn-helix domain-containing protein n=1 Tax=Bradyrhizobium oropedii TaxID=1571201 RepID=UPI001E52CD31|nr:hypothetical protein [Bradyrhizobium oropedii]MCC8963739.1 hypothetical protein [Bradyrhizobium oropedii]